MKIKCAVILVGILFLISGPSYAEGLTLEDYLSQVKDANPGIQSANLRANALADRVGPAGVLDDPFIAAGIDEVPFDGMEEEDEYVMRYQISQAIPFPGKLSAKSGIAKSRADSARSDALTLQREISVLAVQAFYRAYYNQKAIGLNNRIKKVIDDTVSSTKSRYETGGEGHHDLLLAKIELSSLDVDRLKLLREQETLLAVMNELRGQPADTHIDDLIVDLSIDADAEEVSPLENQPELKSLESFVAQSEKEERLARLAYYPDFVLQGMAMDPSPDMMDEKSNWGVMVGMNIPIYAGLKQSGLLNAAIRDKEAALREKSSLENRLKTELVAAREQLDTAKAVVALYKESVIPTTNLAVDNARSSYAAGRLPLTDYLDTLKTQRTQELEYLAAQIDIELAEARLKELLSAPPVLRLAPSRPSLFGGRGMSGGMGSDTVNMGEGMSGPTRKPRTSSAPVDVGAGMGGM